MNDKSYDSTEAAHRYFPPIIEAIKEEMGAASYIIKLALENSNYDGLFEHVRKEDHYRLVGGAWAWDLKTMRRSLPCPDISMPQVVQLFAFVDALIRNFDGRYAAETFGSELKESELLRWNRREINAVYRVLSDLLVVVGDKQR